MRRRIKDNWESYREVSPERNHYFFGTLYTVEPVKGQWVPDEGEDLYICEDEDAWQRYLAAQAELEAATIHLHSVMVPTPPSPEELAVAERQARAMDEWSDCRHSPSCPRCGANHADDIVPVCIPFPLD